MIGRQAQRGIGGGGTSRRSRLSSMIYYYILFVLDILLFFILFLFFILSYRGVTRPDGPYGARAVKSITKHDDRMTNRYEAGQSVTSAAGRHKDQREEAKMIKAGHEAGSYRWRAQNCALGEPVEELYYSMSHRWKVFGASPLCRACRRACKVAGAVGVQWFACADFLEKD